ncbi:hypothetical protein [Gilvimarinus sp. DA14]|uniref:hypothetical protein n=1 Tax=Gilvimarinus sp. DA14 TaxID=2956798 RepID=UPI0020B6D09A|nr:hypothetical protein [Gilvimarinus sp. DA14]UTF58587.1 hypothetical protein NHM04_08840 [Gilvimarinus sp. DA14]
MSIEQSTPLQWGEGRSVTPVRGLPEKLPSGIVRLEETQYVYVHADHGSEMLVSMAVPIPFVTDMAISSYKESVDNAHKDQYANSDPYTIPVRQMQNHPAFRASGGDYTLYPVVVLSETSDERYLLSLVYQIESGDWMSRYFYHLPMSIAADDIQSIPEAQLAQLAQQLEEGAAILIDTIEKRVSGEIPEHGPAATLGSLYFVSGKIGGLVGAEVFKVKDCEILLEAEDYIVARVPGDPDTDAAGGGLAYGVHYLYRNQLNLFDRQAP